MANKRIVAYASGSTLYDIFRDQDGQVVHNTTFALEAWGASGHTRADYAIALTDASGDLYTSEFDDDFPVGAELYVNTYLRAGATPADGDTLLYGPTKIEWSGAALIVDGEDITVTALCNYALMKLGGAYKEHKLTSYFETSDTAELCQRLWPQVRKEVLIRGSKEGVNWSEATKYAESGAALTGVNIPEMAEWEYAFALTTDCLRVIAQVDESNRTTEYGFEVMRSMLLTNDYSNGDADSAYIKYIYDNDDVASYSPSLYNAMAVKLASELAPVIVDAKRRSELIQEFEGLIMSLAVGKNQAEVYNDDKGDTDPAGRRFNKYGKKS